jgi:hypothetical protein
LDRKSGISENPNKFQESNEEEVIEADKFEESVPKIETIVCRKI